MQRTIPYYVDNIVPDSIAQGKNVLIASSENAIRGLLMHLCEVSDIKVILPIIPKLLIFLANTSRTSITIFFFSTLFLTSDVLHYHDNLFTAHMNHKPHHHHHHHYYNLFSQYIHLFSLLQSPRNV